MKEKNSVTLVTAHRVKNRFANFQIFVFVFSSQAINLARCKTDRRMSLQTELLIFWRSSLLEQCCDTSATEPKCVLVLVYSVIHSSKKSTPFHLFQQLQYLRQTKRCMCSGFYSSILKMAHKTPLTMSHLSNSQQ